MEKNTDPAIIPCYFSVNYPFTACPLIIFALTVFGQERPHSGLDI